MNKSSDYNMKTKTNKLKDISVDQPGGDMK